MWSRSGRCTADGLRAATPEIVWPLAAGVRRCEAVLLLLLLGNVSLIIDGL
jgi:hypothetical protein